MTIKWTNIGNERLRWNKKYRIYEYNIFQTIEYFKVPFDSFLLLIDVLKKSIHWEHM